MATLGIRCALDMYALPTRILHTMWTWMRKQHILEYLPKVYCKTLVLLKVTLVFKTEGECTLDRQNCTDVTCSAITETGTPKAVAALNILAPSKCTGNPCWHLKTCLSVHGGQ